MKENFKIIIIVLFFCVLLSCSSNNSEKLIGEWSGNNLNDGSQVEYIFAKDNTFKIKNNTFDSDFFGVYSYNNKENVFELKFDSNGSYIVKYKTEFSDNYNELFLVGYFGETIFKVKLKKVIKM